MPARLDIQISGTPDELDVTIRDLSLVADAVEQWAAKFLRERGYAVGKFIDWETPAQFCKRIGISKMTFVRKTRDQRASGMFEAHWGPLRRQIVQIASTPEFDAFCLDPRRKP